MPGSPGLKGMEGREGKDGQPGLDGFPGPQVKTRLPCRSDIQRNEIKTVPTDWIPEGEKLQMLAI